MGSYDGSGSGAHDRPMRGPKWWAAICVECGEKCRVPFDPLDQTPRCRECFEKKKAADRRR